MFFINYYDSNQILSLPSSGVAYQAKHCRIGRIFCCAWQVFCGVSTPTNILCCPSLLNIIKEPEFVKFHQKDFFCWNIKSVPEKSLLKHLVGAWEEKIPVVNQWLSKSVNDILIREIAKCKSFFSRILNQGGCKEYLSRVLLNRSS